MEMFLLNFDFIFEVLWIVGFPNLTYSLWSYSINNHYIGNRSYNRLDIEMLFLF